MNAAFRPISESELLVPALRVAASRSDGTVRTSDLIEELETLFRPRGPDAEILRQRSDTKFSQKVRNIISHRNNRTGIARRGLAEIVHGGFRITEAGRKFLLDEGH
jgi:spore maturation protein CgeB